MSTVDQSTQEVIDEIVRMSHGDIDRVRELVDLHPGLVSARSTWNEAPIEAAAHCGQREIAELLLAAGADLDICTAAMLGDTGRVSDFLQQNPGLAHATGAHGIPVLFFAAMAGHIGIAELLRRHGASVNAGEGGNMALHAAAAFGRPQMAEWLIANGAKIDVPSYNGQTPLALAIDRGHNNVAELLRQHGGKDQS